MRQAENPNQCVRPTGCERSRDGEESLGTQISVRIDWSSSTVSGDAEVLVDACAQALELEGQQLLQLVQESLPETDDQDTSLVRMDWVVEHADKLRCHKHTDVRGKGRRP